MTSEVPGIVFIGNVAFSAAMLEEVLKSGIRLHGVVTTKKSEFNSDFVDLGTVVNQQVPVHYTIDVNSAESLNWIKGLSPDYCFCFGWSSLLKRDLLQIPRRGVIGYHPAALPSNRGRHPLIWALALGLHETASTFFFMDEGADSGPILSQVKIQIDADEDAARLYRKVVQTAARQVQEFIPALISNTYRLQAQDTSKANYWRKRSKKDGEIDWRMSGEAIYNLVRALSKPYPGAHFAYKGAEIRVWKVKRGAKKPINMEPGKVIEVSGQMFSVSCYDEIVEVLEHESHNIPKKGEYI